MFAKPLRNPAFGVIFFIESPLKLMGNAFYFILKALFIL